MKKNGKMPPIYQSYVFKDKDPVIGELRSLLEDRFKRVLVGKDLRHVSSHGGPSVGAMRSWFWGKTRRPTNATIEAAGRSVGYERVWRRRRDLEGA
jgi:hypothetical protein